jgi:hypothetical protein
MKGLFGTQKVSKGFANEAVGMVQMFFRHRGMDPARQEVEGAEGCGWWLTEGSAKIYIFVQDSPNGALLRITGPIVFLPANDREVFYRRLLDLNTNLTNCALSVHDNVVLVVAQRPTLGMVQEELEEQVWNVAYVADLLDNKLADEFGVQLYSEQARAGASGG